MYFISKKFCELSAAEVYEILKSRAEIFLLEQGIVCQDLDDVDYDSLHCFFWDGKRVTAYLRAFESLKDDGVVTVDAGLTSICLFADNKTIQNRFMRMLKDARSFGVDPQALYGE